MIQLCINRCIVSTITCDLKMNIDFECIIKKLCKHTQLKDTLMQI